MTAAIDGREIELKFKLKANEIPKFKKAVEATTGHRATWSKSPLSARYFDTTDNRLAERGVSLRTRAKGDLYFQTMKASNSGSGGLMNRLEWEAQVPGPDLDLVILPADARRALGVIVDAELEPIIIVDVDRQTAVAEKANPMGPDLKVEIAIDKGKVSAGGASERFVECEFEFLEGDVTRFLDFIGDILEKCPMPLSGVTKAERGYLLIAGNGPKVHWVPKFRLTTLSCRSCPRHSIRSRR